MEGDIPSSSSRSSRRCENEDVEDGEIDADDLEEGEIIESDQEGVESPKGVPSAGMRSRSPQPSTEALKATTNDSTLKSDSARTNRKALDVWADYYKDRYKQQEKSGKLQDSPPDFKESGDSNDSWPDRHVERKRRHAESRSDEKRKRGWASQAPSRGKQERPKDRKRERTHQQKPLCRFWSLGQCKKGDTCEFRHGDRPKKRDVCKFYSSGVCTRGSDCLFMHSEFPCKFFHTHTSCYNGANCRFSHDQLTPEMEELLKKSLVGSHEDTKQDPEPIPVSMPPVLPRIYGNAPSEDVSKPIVMLDIAPSLGNPHPSIINQLLIAKGRKVLLPYPTEDLPVCLQPPRPDAGITELGGEIVKEEEDEVQSEYGYQPEQEQSWEMGEHPNDWISEPPKEPPKPEMEPPAKQPRLNENFPVFGEPRPFHSIHNVAEPDQDNNIVYMPMGPPLSLLPLPVNHFNQAPEKDDLIYHHDVGDFNLAAQKQSSPPPQQMVMVQNPRDIYSPPQPPPHHALLPSPSLHPHFAQPPPPPLPPHHPHLHHPHPHPHPHPHHHPHHHPQEFNPRFSPPSLHSMGPLPPRSMAPPSQPITVPRGEFYSEPLRPPLLPRMPPPRSFQSVEPEMDLVLPRRSRWTPSDNLPTDEQVMRQGPDRHRGEEMLLQRPFEEEVPTMSRPSFEETRSFSEDRRRQHVAEPEAGPGPGPVIQSTIQVSRDPRQRAKMSKAEESGGASSLSSVLGIRMEMPPPALKKEDVKPVASADGTAGHELKVAASKAPTLADMFKSIDPTASPFG